MLKFWKKWRGHKSTFGSDKDTKNNQTPDTDAESFEPSLPEAVGAFYDKYNDKFLDVYGQVIQAFRTTDVHKLLDYQIQSIGFEEGQRVLDAGCGVCGPAIYFAQKKGVEVEAVTISKVQQEEARKRIAEEGIQEKVHVKLGDFHQLDALYEPESFDIIYFLESFGHSHDHALALESAWKALKPGGKLYLKDLFRKVAPFPELQPRIDQEIRNINQAYRYHIADLYEVLHAARKLGFVISSLKTIDLKIEEFENLTISNDFQELTGIGKIENWAEYIFPVDFFELSCYKPVYDLSKGMHRFFLQNLYHIQVHNLKSEEL